MLNHFYRAGAYFWDSGSIAYQATFSTSWPMLLPPLEHRPPSGEQGLVFRIHVEPIFFLTSALHQLIPFIPAAAYFSVLQGLWSGLLGLAVFIACARSDNLALAAMTAVATAFCGPVLAEIGFPHVELAIPSLLILFLALRSAGYRTGSYVALGLCLLVREDAGFHAGGLLVLLALAQQLSGDSRGLARQNALIACICIAYSIFALAFQHLFYPAVESGLRSTYLGDPIGSHLSWSLVQERITTFLKDKAYATWPLILVLAAAAWQRNIILAVGPLSVLPWMLMSLLAVSDIAGNLTSQYSFPTIAAIAWPSIVFAMNKARMGLGLQLCTSILSIALFGLLGGGNHDNAPWRGLAIPNFRAIGNYETALRNVVARRNEFGRLMVDDAVASLVPERLMTDEWTNQWAFDHLPNPDVVVYKDGAWDSANTMQVIDASGLTHRCQIENTPFFIASREGSSYCR
jgi:hypothetical protein